jgi:NAD(P)-dependent dehydrogenase (short-subunit alcohol dehydrogenase family)
VTGAAAALVTGAGSGIGRATALRFAREGTPVVAVDLVGADRTASEITARGGTALAIRLDVCDPVGWQDAVARAESAYGAVGTLANVAGVPSAAPDTAADQSDAGWERVIAINQSGPFYGMRAVLPSMARRGGGAIVNVASVAALVGLPNTFAYAASKGALIALSRQAAVEYAAAGIRVNVVCPGLTDTPILGRVDEAVRALCRRSTPLARLGTPDEVASMIVHLAHPESSYVTGQVVAVDGGWTAQ